MLVTSTKILQFIGRFYTRAQSIWDELGRTTFRVRLVRRLVVRPTTGLYGDLPAILASLQIRRQQFSGHCSRSKDDIVSQLFLWDPQHGRHSRGRPTTTFVDQREEDTGLFRQELPAVMAGRGEWDKLIKSLRVRPKYIDRLFV